LTHANVGLRFASRLDAHSLCRKNRLERLAMKESKQQTTAAEGRSGLIPSRVTVLHVDDDPNDTELLRAASRKAGIAFELRNVSDGEQAIAYLSGQGKYADRVQYGSPSLVLLDLKMPRATGFEILHWIRSHPEFARLPVIVLSGSQLQEDIRQAYAQGANSYLVKPLGFDSLVELVKRISAVWITSTFEMLGP
jgi:CheY-like chemotaxis protein